MLPAGIFGSRKHNLVFKFTYNGSVSSQLRAMLRNIYFTNSSDRIKDRLSGRFMICLPAKIVYDLNIIL